MSRLQRRAGVLMLVLFAVLFGVSALRAATPGEFTLQARLTDSNGKPLPDGTIARVAFRMYSDSGLADSSFLWGEAHTNVPIARGIVTVRLGAGAEKLNADGSSAGSGPNPISPTLFDGSTRYLQIRVNSDPPLSPAIPLVSVPYALSAGSVNGKTEDQISAPVGTIIDWLPATAGASPPASWMVCDGSIVTDAASPFNGKALPDLRGRFTRGVDAANAASLAAGTYPDAGGQNSATIDVSHSHTVAPHAHSIPPHSHHVTGVTDIPTPNTDTTAQYTLVFHADLGFDKHTHHFTTDTDLSQPMTTGSSGGSTDSQTLQRTIDNRPLYVGLLKIIRVK